MAGTTTVDGVSNTIKKPGPTYVSYSGVDIKAIIHVPPDFSNKAYYTQENDSSYASKPLVLADIQTLSYSIYREKYPVRALGYGYPKSFTRGPRTISGSLIFTMFDQHVLYDVMGRIQQDTTNDVSTALIDQLPRFDITVTFANEHGSISRMAIHGVELYSEGATLSIEDLITENVVQYTAQDFTPMTRNLEAMEHLGYAKEKSATELLTRFRKEREFALGRVFD